MPAQTAEQRKRAEAQHEMLEERRESKKSPVHVNREMHEAIQNDTVVQTTMGTKGVTVPVVNFDGGNDAGSCPNDPNGAVGDSQFVQMYNSSYAVYDKTGKALTSPIDLASYSLKFPVMMVTP